MVPAPPPLDFTRVALSVLALSSRFDGLRDGKLPRPPFYPFSTRSVESF